MGERTVVPGVWFEGEVHGGADGGAGCLVWVDGFADWGI